MKKTLSILAGLLTVAFLTMAATQQADYSQPVSSVNFTTSSTTSGEFPVPVGKMVSVVIYKTGAGKGQAYLQGSNDGGGTGGSGWKDINATTYPGASGAVAAGSQAIMLNAEAVPWARVRYLFKEDGTNTGVITGGKWISK